MACAVFGDIPDTDTNVTLASYRYSTSGFYTFQEAVDQRDSEIDDGIYTYRRTNNRRSRMQVNLSQRVSDWGSAYLNGYQQDYWNMAGHERSVSAGLSSGWRGITWSVSYSLTRTPDANTDRQMALMVNVPLSRWLANAWSTYSANTASGGFVSHQVGSAARHLRTITSAITSSRPMPVKILAMAAAYPGATGDLPVMSGWGITTGAITDSGTTARRVQLLRMNME